MTLHQAALDYSARGWAVLPLAPLSKTPACPHGFLDATTDVKQINRWWTENPNHNIGIRTGEASGVFVVDIDINHASGVDGQTALDDLVPPNLLPSTVTANTPRGGRHLYFAQNGEGYKSNQGNIGPGVDCKGEGGYIVASPSVTEAGSYSWQDPPDETPLAPIPDIFRPFLNVKRVASDVLSPNEGTVKDTDILEGQRESSLTQLAGAMRGCGSSEATIYQTLKADNERCKPPLADADLRKIAKSVCSYEPNADSFPHTDSGNAERLVAAHPDQLLFCTDWKQWLVWTRVRWQPDKAHRLQKMAKGVARGMYTEAGTIEDDSIRAKLVRHARASESLSRRQAMVTLAQSEVPVELTELDRDDWLLCVGNGTMNLRSAEIRDSRQDDYITKQAAVDYDPDAKCPTFMRFIGEVFGNNAALIRYVQKALGYSLTGSAREQVLFFCWGTGANGKSTLLGIVQRILGDYAISAPSSTILQSRNENIPNDVATLKGVRMAVMQEIAQGKRLDEELVKNITGGDIISGRFLHAEFFQFRPQCKLWIGCNHKPRIYGQDLGIWRRIVLVPFTVSIAPEQQDKDLPAKLDAERSGIFNWILEGLQTWLTEGLHAPDAVTDATETYRTEEDLIGDFLADCIESDPGWHLPVTDLAGAYKQWAESHGEKVQTQQWLSRRLSDHGIEKGRDNKGRFWKNVALRVLNLGERGDT